MTDTRYQELVAKWRKQADVFDEVDARLNAEGIEITNNRVAAASCRICADALEQAIAAAQPPQDTGELHDECVDGNPCLQRGCLRCEGYKGQAGERTNGYKLRERPPGKRIDEILENRDWAMQHLHMRYEARRDYLQLCAEIEHLRADRPAAAQPEPRGTTAGGEGSA